MMMLEKIRNRSNYVLNNESGDVPIAMIGFIFVGILIVLIAVQFKERIRAFFTSAGQNVDSWSTTEAPDTTTTIH